MRRSKPVLAAVAALSLALQGCGGGGGGGSTSAAASTPPAEGAYFGTLSNGRQHYTLVLENGQFYTLYGSTSNGIFGVSGFLQGNGSSNNGSYSSSDVRDASASNPVLQSATLSASYTAGSSFNGTLVEGSTSVSFTGAGLGAAIYNYNSAANLAAVSGTWNLTSLRGYPVTLNIAAAGTFTGTSSGCSLSGTIKPRSSGKNVFDVALTYGASPCILAGQSLGGIAISYVATTGQQELAVTLLDQARVNSSAFFGIR